jgi:hypothetical protein
MNDYTKLLRAYYFSGVQNGLCSGLIWTRQFFTFELDLLNHLQAIAQRGFLSIPSMLVISLPGSYKQQKQISNSNLADETSYYTGSRRRK